jgi:cell division protein FtsW
LKILQLIKGDRVIWIIVLLLSLLSILVVYSSVVQLAYRFRAGNVSSYLIKHIVIIGASFIIMYFTHKLKYIYYSRISQIGIIIVIPLLLYTLIKGVSAGEAARWLPIPGTGLTFQTSDLAKLALIIYVARLLSLKQNTIKDFKTGFLPIIIPISVICALILPANFSTSALLFITCITLLFIGGISLKYIFTLLGIGAVALSFIILTIFQFPDLIPRGKTWKARVENFISDDSQSNYQAEQAKIAVAKGGIIGTGPGHSTQRNFLPQAASDFIYAIIIEEYGSFIGIFILFLYMVLLFRSIRILRQAEKSFGGFLAVGLSFSLVFQALVNMAVAVNLFPVTGQPLPLISMGGTSIWFTAIALGIILSVSKSIEENEKENELETA